MPDWLGTLAGGMALVAGMYVFAACLWAAERRLPRDAPADRKGGRATLQEFRADWAAGLRALVPVPETVNAGNRLQACLRVFLLGGTALLAFAAVPFGPALLSSTPDGTVPLILVPELDPGVLLVLALYGPGAFGLLTAGAADRERVRTLLELSVPLWLAVAGPAAASGTLHLGRIAARQAASGVWWCVEQPLGFAVCLTAVLMLTTYSWPFPPARVEESTSRSESAERQRTSGLRGLTGYLHLILFAYLLVLLFFGGWHLWGLAPGNEQAAYGWPGGLLRVVVLHGKVLAVLAGLVGLRRSGLAAELAERAATAAPVLAAAGMVHFVMAGFFRTVLPQREFLLKAAAGWGVLTLVLGTIAWWSGRTEAE